MSEQEKKTLAEDGPAADRSPKTEDIIPSKEEKQKENPKEKFTEQKNTPHHRKRRGDTSESEINSGQKAPETGGNGENPAKKGGKQPVVVYLTIMFAAAFLLLLLAYFIQQRNNQAVIDDLQLSVDKLPSLEELVEENQTLSDANEALSAENDDLRAENEALNQQYTSVSNWYARVQTESDLRDTLYTTEYLCEAGDYQTAAECLATVNEDDLLVISTTSSYGVPSDSQRYETLKEALIEAGYLTEDPNSGQLQATVPEA